MSRKKTGSEAGLSSSITHRFGVTVSSVPLIPEGDIAVPVKLILGQNFRWAGSVVVFDQVSKSNDFLTILFQRNRDFITVIQNESDGISGMNDRPVNSIGAAADGHFGQIVIGNQAEPTAGEHLIILVDDVILRQSLQQVQSCCTDSTVFILQLPVSDDCNCVSVEAEIIRIIDWIIHPMQIGNFNFETHCVGHPQSKYTRSDQKP